MKNKILVATGVAIVILACASLIYACFVLHKKETNEDNHLIEITFKELQEKVDNKESFILLISQTNCSHCIEYKPVLKEVLAEYDIVAYEIAKDKLSNEDRVKLNNIANVDGTPNTVFIENGEEKNTSSRLVGTVSESKLKSRLKAQGYIKE